MGKGKVAEEVKPLAQNVEAETAGIEKTGPEENKVVRAKKVKGMKKAKPPKLPKQKRETRSARKQRIMYEKALKKTSAERAISLIAILLALVGAIVQALGEKYDVKTPES